MLRRLLIFFGIALALALVVWGVVAFLNRESGIRNQELGNTNTLTQPFSNGEVGNTQLPQVNQNTNAVTQAPVLSPEELEKETLGQFARDFASRFATYSNQNFASNFTELLPQTTGSAREYLERLQQEYQKLQEEYVGVTSWALALRWEEYQAGSDRVRAVVSLRRQETRGEEEEMFNQDLELTLVRIDGDWRVQEIKWGERY